MRFCDLFPGAEYLARRADMLKSDGQRSCWVCGAQTSWIEINFACYVCSEECLMELDAGYAMASEGDNG